MAFGIPDLDDLKKLGMELIDHAKATLVPALRDAVIQAMHDSLHTAKVTTTVEMPTKEQP